ncbi:MAG: Phosphonopyruvate decarboxylase [Myxococcaceae bacterium]|nr:Phosphonopyruvate decarboxylase [Myxococcaceae bacterium]
MAIKAESFLEKGRQAGIELYTGVPCSYLKPFINYVIDSPKLHYIGATNEGDAVAIASGAELCGKHAAVMFQNSGFGNTVNPLTSLNMIFKIPVLVIATLRGEPGGPADEPQHDLMGKITTGLFELMQIPWEYFPQEEADIASVLERAVTHMTRVRTPYALVMKKDSVESYKLQTKASPRALPALTPDTTPWSKDLPSRTDVLRVVQKAARPNDALVATTGYTGRELYALDDKANQIYMVGSMGCASSFGLGIAWAKPNKRAVVLDGDGAALMRLGALATLGYERPKNLLHIVLDNEAHDSTGGQSTVSHSVDFVTIAKACGYPKALRVASLEELGNVVAADHDALTFVHVKTKPGAPKDLPRPTVTPLEVGDRLRQWLAT